MVKTAINPAVEVAAAARSASDRAKHTNGPQEIEEAIFEWERAVQMMADSGNSEEQADILASFADSLLMRWNLSHQLDDIRTVVSNLERAIEKLSHSSKTRRDLLIRLAGIYEDWYHNFKGGSEALNNAIGY
jgi:hypothetical protein